MKRTIDCFILYMDIFMNYNDKNESIINEKIYRSGIGFDVHAFDIIKNDVKSFDHKENDTFIIQGSLINSISNKNSSNESSNNSLNFIYLCGVKIPHKFAILAHSDGDVALHALTDSILGAIAAGSIGEHFPPSDNKWRNAKSEIFVRHAITLMKAMNGELINIDMTIICQQPKIMPHALMMKENLSDILAIKTSRINIKAVTTEKLGFLGREEGIAVQAISTVRMPND